MRQILIVAIALVAGFALGQRQGGDRPGMRGGFPGAGIGFGIFDTDRDGTLSAGEIGAAAGSLAKLDQDSDGRITAEEMRQAMPQGRGGRGPGRGDRGGAVDNSGVDDMVKMLMGFDANSDGKLAKTELPERMQGIFDRGDADKDGFLSAAEVRSVAGAQAPGAAAGGPQGGRGREMNPFRMDPVLAALDGDRDSVLSADEIHNSSATLRKLDKNGDGQLTRPEIAPAADPGERF